MQILDRKAARDIWLHRMPLLAIVLVMAAGVASLVMARSTVASLRSARDAYYDTHRFGDVFASLKRAPERVAGEVAAIPGVALVQSRVIHDANLRVPGNSDPCTGRLVSLPDDSDPLLNGVHLRRGRLPEARDEAVVSEPFADANRLRPGDSLDAVVNGRYHRLTIVGVAIAPEFVYFVRGGELLPDNRRSGVLWMRRQALADALDMDGAFNDIVVRVTPDASRAAVIAEIDRTLDRHGGLGAYDRQYHPSDRYVRDEFQQLGIMGTITPAVFLGVGAFLVNMVVGRLTRTQREEIATLKAFGLSTLMLSRHVAVIALAVAISACMLGVVIGWVLGDDLARVYAQMFSFPSLEFRLEPAAIVLSVAVADAASGAGAAASLRWIVRLQPAEAMRPEAPRSYRTTVLERVGLRYPVRVRMALRGLRSHPRRTLFGVAGVALASAVLVVSNFAFDAIDFMIDREYRASQRYSDLVTFNEAVERRALGSLRNIDAGQAVLVAEPVRYAPATLIARNRERRVAVIGLENVSTLMRLLDSEGRPVDVPSDGLLLSKNLASALHARPGDSLDVRFLTGMRRTVSLPIAGVYEGMVGLSAYMSLDALNIASGDGLVISGAMLLRDDSHSSALYLRLGDSPAVASVTSKRGIIIAFRETIAEHIVRITVLHALFGGVIAIGVVYNMAHILFAERKRELATLRVLGFTSREATATLQREIGAIAVVGMLAGLLLGRAFAWCLVRALETENYVFPLVISPSTYASSALLTLLSAGCSAWLVRRNVARLDLLAALKSSAS